MQNVFKCSHRLFLKFGHIEIRFLQNSKYFLLISKTPWNENQNIPDFRVMGGQIECRFVFHTNIFPQGIVFEMISRLGSQILDKLIALEHFTCLQLQGDDSFGRACDKSNELLLV